MNMLGNWLKTSILMAGIAVLFGMLFSGGDRERGVNPAVALLIMNVAPIAAMLIQRAISRSREFEADHGGAQICGDPQALTAALQKIHNHARRIPLEAAQQHPETAQMMIINPLSAAGIQSLFSTHPQTEERVARLMEMAQGVA
jgi:heat shock protein HtpX